MVASQKYTYGYFFLWLNNPAVSKNRCVNINSNTINERKIMIYCTYIIQGSHMLFNSIQFLIFFPIVCLVYFAVPKKIKWIWLLLASYYFYMCWNPKYALLMFTSTFITWLSGIFIEHFSHNENKKLADRKKKLAVALSFISNLAILFMFKYFNFAVDTINTLFARMSIAPLSPSFDVILPVGISFYTFQALSYTMDVYRNDIPCEKNLFRYMLFVSFFPQLVAGPIERSKNLLHQLKTPLPFSCKRVKSGLLLMLWGFFQKLVIADRAAFLVNTVYNNYSEYGGVELILATVLFALQIYCDFSSYTDIAKGAAEVMGFHLMDNFNRPYFSRSIAEFWRNWHISLSGWFKDYLYIPLGGNRKGKLRKYINIMIVFISSGLWHGASMTFVVWGFLHGIYQIIGDATAPLRDMLLSFFKIDKNTHAHRLVQRLITFALVCFGWIFFRANSLSDARGIINKILFDFNPWCLTDGGILKLGFDTAQWLVTLCGTLVLFAVSCGHTYKVRFRENILSSNIFVRYTVAMVMIFTVLIFGIYGPGYDASQFIYFQF